MDGEALVKVRQKFIDEQQRLLMNSAAKWQIDLLNKIMEKFVKELTLSNGIITNDAGNVSIMSALDKIFADFEAKTNASVVNKLTTDMTKLATMNADYYSLYSTNSQNFLGITRAVNKTVRNKLGYDNKGNIIKHSYLDNFSQDKSVRLEVRKLAYKYVTGGRKMSDLLAALHNTVIGSPVAPGVLERHLKTFGYDLYAQYDRSINKEFAKRLDLKYFVYAGGLIEGSREFCRKRNNKVFTTEEAEQWVNDPTLPRTKAERDNGAVTDYVPVEDMGRWNCRHIARFISEEQAARLGRPELSPDAKPTPTPPPKDAIQNRTS